MSDFPFGFAGGASSGGSSSGGSGSGGSSSGGSSSGGSSSGGGSGSGSGGSGGGFGGINPFGFLGGDPSGGNFFLELQKLLTGSTGPVNWELARQLAVQGAGSGEPPTSVDDARAIEEAARLAELWLDDVTTLPSGTTTGEAWTRVHWVEATLPVWRTLCDPVAAKVAETMRTTLQSGLSSLSSGDLPFEMPFEVPPEVLSQLASGSGQFLGVLDSVAGMFFGAQVGQALGALAQEVVSSTEVGLPLGPTGRAALLPANVAAFAEGLEVPLDEVRLYLALREAAHHRLFGHVPWLRARLLGAVEEYARGITVDPEAIGRAAQSLDVSDPESLQQALNSGGLFETELTPQQQAALTRLEALLALVEGWVDEIVDAAAVPRLPNAARLRETVRRRRATGGPAEQTFATLVGLELRPRRLRDAAKLWRQLTETLGTEGRDQVWAHPDIAPGAADLDDPEAYVASRAAGDEPLPGFE